MEVTSDIESILKDAVKETGRELDKSAREVAEYATKRAAHLTAVVGQPGFERALRAERDSVALFAGIHAVAGADAADNRIVGIIQGALGLAARALA